MFFSLLYSRFSRQRLIKKTEGLKVFPPCLLRPPWWFGANLGLLQTVDRRNLTVQSSPSLSPQLIRLRLLLLQNMMQSLRMGPVKPADLAKHRRSHRHQAKILVLRKLCTGFGLRCKQKIPQRTLPPTSIAARPAGTLMSFVNVFSQSKIVQRSDFSLRRSLCFRSLGEAEVSQAKP